MALEFAQAGDVCARNGCRVTWTIAAEQARRQDVCDAQVAPWRHPEWNDSMVRELRTKLTEQAAELDRLREENGLLRRWVSRHVDPEKTVRPGTVGR